MFARLTLRVPFGRLLKQSVRGICVFVRELSRLHLTVCLAGRTHHDQKNSFRDSNYLQPVKHSADTKEAQEDDGSSTAQFITTDDTVTFSELFPDRFFKTWKSFLDAHELCPAYFNVASRGGRMGVRSNNVVHIHQFGLLKTPG